MAIEVISWKSAANVFAFRFPESDFTTLSQLVVEESQEAFVSIGGRFEGPFPAGTYTLNTKNFPFLENFVNRSFLKSRSPFTADVYFIQKSYTLNLPWGTPSPIQVRDPLYEIMLPVRAFGQYGMCIKNSRKFLTKLVGTVPAFTGITLRDHFRGMLIMEVKTAIGQYILQKKISILELAASQSELAELVSTRLSEAFDEFGIEIKSFAIASLEADESDPAVSKLRDALAQRAEMRIVGYNYQQMRSFDALETAAGNEGSGGMSANMMGAGMGLAMGAGFGGALAGGTMQTGTPMQFSANPAQTPQTPPAPQASVPAGKLCPNCKTSVPADAKFCPSCGQKMQFACAKCGCELSAGTKFCPECGEKV